MRRAATRVLILSALIAALVAPSGGDQSAVAAATPQVGNWTGQTGSGQPMSFTVGSSGSQWEGFTLKMTFSGLCSGWIEITVPGPGPIGGGGFDVHIAGDPEFDFTGTFDTATSAHGTYSFYDPSPTGCSVAISQTGTWTATTAGGAPSGPACLGRQATHVGTAGADTIYGTPGADVIVGLGGNDRIYGLGGNDRVCGGAGNDIIHGGFGSDKVNGNSGKDEVFGEGGRDILKGGNGNDVLKGNAGNDKLFGLAGNDILKGGAGTDKVTGGTGTDTCYGETKASCELPSAASTDKQLIRNLIRDWSDSWHGGLANVGAFIAAHNYPDWNWSAGQCAAALRDEGYQDGDTEEATVRAGTIRRDDDWRIPNGLPGAGQIPRGRVYEMTVDWVTFWVGGGQDTATGDIHATVIGSEAHFFMPCG